MAMIYNPLKGWTVIPENDLSLTKFKDPYRQIDTAYVLGYKIICKEKDNYSNFKYELYHHDDLLDSQEGKYEVAVDLHTEGRNSYGPNKVVFFVAYRHDGFDVDVYLKTNIEISYSTGKDDLNMYDSLSNTKSNGYGRVDSLDVEDHLHNDHYNIRPLIRFINNLKREDSDILDSGTLDTRKLEMAIRKNDKNVIKNELGRLRKNIKTALHPDKFMEDRGKKWAHERYTQSDNLFNNIDLQ
jgi:hypothetical protein